MKGIIGTICGDIIGSTHEFNPIKTKEFPLYQKNSKFTDDTIMTLAIANWLMKNKNSRQILIDEIKYFGNKYPNAGYGGMFREWLKSENPHAYGSWANGSAMRVSPVAWVGDSLEEVQKLAKLSAEITHNHPDAIKGALATADAIYLSRIDISKEEIKNHIELRYDYDLSRRLEDIRPNYKFDVSCSGSVPEAIICFLESKSFEDTIRNAISLGGDADTQAAIAGGIASAYYDIPKRIYYKAIHRLDYDLLNVLIDFEEFLENK